LNAVFVRLLACLLVVVLSCLVYCEFWNFFEFLGSFWFVFGAGAVVFCLVAVGLGRDVISVLVVEH